MVLSTSLQLYGGARHDWGCFRDGTAIDAKIQPFTARHMGGLISGKITPGGTDLLSPLRLYQQHNELFERAGAGATQSKTPKRGSLVWSGSEKAKETTNQTINNLSSMNQ